MDSRLFTIVQFLRVKSPHRHQPTVLRRPWVAVSTDTAHPTRGKRKALVLRSERRRETDPDFLRAFPARLNRASTAYVAKVFQVVLPSIRKTRDDMTFFRTCALSYPTGVSRYLYINSILHDAPESLIGSLSRSVPPIKFPKWLLHSPTKSIVEFARQGTMKSD